MKGLCVFPKLTDRGSGGREGRMKKPWERGNRVWDPISQIREAQRELAVPSLEQLA